MRRFPVRLIAMVVAISSFAAARGEVKNAAPGDTSHNQRSSQMENCIRACAKCAEQCESCFAHCTNLVAEGKKRSSHISENLRRLR